ncbi:MAG TPA: hypothetical protein PKU85_04925, partial [Bacteroidales bacterium]|nr:hypothetical protein [Bacteroidales bacterium]
VDFPTLGLPTIATILILSFFVKHPFFFFGASYAPFSHVSVVTDGIYREFSVLSNNDPNTHTDNTQGYQTQRQEK